MSLLGQLLTPQSSWFSLGLLWGLESPVWSLMSTLGAALGTSVLTLPSGRFQPSCFGMMWGTCQTHQPPTSANRAMLELSTLAKAEWAEGQ